MALIKICEIGPLPDSPGFTAKLNFDGGADYAVQVLDPFEPGEEQSLEWYFEEHLSQPFLNGVKAQAAADSVKAYGERLFQQLFLDPPKVFSQYTQCRDNLEALRIEVEGSPAFHALHWEALKDPDLPLPLALEAVMVRSRRVEQAVAARIAPAPALRVLVVTARPRGEHDVAYRTISRPLVEAVRNSQAPVNIDILRPGTYQALEHHLQSRRGQAEAGGGFYHIIHFDTHDALLSHAEFLAGGETGKLTYRRYGRSNLPAYEGKKAFLFLEGEDGGADAVEAGELAALLTTHRIPITLLNACQSGKQIGASETSLGSRLLEAGVQLVLAMGYSITVSAAEILMTRLYEQLFAGQDVAAAIRAGRRELYNDKQRRAYFNHNIDLEDWLLPVVYQNRPVQLQTRPFTPAEEQDYWTRQAAGFPAANTAYGFVGRDLDILAIERKLHRHNLLLVRGMGGAGKTTLLKYLGHWWQATGFVDRVFYFGYDEQGWTRQQLMHHLAKALWGEADYHARFVPLPAAAQQAKLAQALRGQRHLLLLDNLESITGSHLAIAHGLAAEEQTALRELLAALSGGLTCVLLGSRGGESWLAPGTFDKAIHELHGLDPEAASQLAELILQRQRIKDPRNDPDFAHLMKLLDGFPLALEVVLSNLSRQTPAEVLEALQAGGVELDSGGSLTKTESIVRCVDYAFGNLDPDAQRLLECLAPFSGVFNSFYLPQYIEALQQQPLLAGYPFVRWQAVLQAAGDWGLLSPLPEYPEMLRLQPVFPYFLRRRRQDDAQAAERQTQIDAAFFRHYNHLAGAIASCLESKDSRERATGLCFGKLEYENLLNALHLGLTTQQSILNPYHALTDYLDAIHDEPNGLALGEQVMTCLLVYPTAKLEGSIGEELIGVIDDIGRRQLLLTHISEAEKTYNQALKLILDLKNCTPEQKRKYSATLYHQLGLVAQKQRQWLRAEDYYHKALAINVEFCERHEQAGTYHQLGSLAENQQQWQQAELYYRQAISINIEFKDVYNQAKTYHHMGRVSEEQRQWQRAELYYQQALAIYVDFKDRYKQAGTYNQLGNVTAKQGHWQRSEQFYKQAFEINLEFNDRYSQAGIYHQLGLIAQMRCEWPQAIQYYQQTLTIYNEYNDLYEQAATYHQLGCVSEVQRLWPQAEKYFQQSLEIMIEFNDRYNQAKTYHKLGIVAQALRQWQLAEQYYRQTLTIRTEFNDRYGQAFTFHQLGRLALEQQQQNAAMEHYLEALSICNEYKDRDGSSVVLGSLAQLWLITVDANIPQQVANLLGISQAESVGLLQRFHSVQ